MPLPETSSPSTLLPKISRPNRGPGETQRQRFRWGEEEARSEGAFDLGRKRRMRSRFRRGQASRPAIRHAQFRGAAPYPVVDASFISFTPPPAAGFTHYTASPLQTKPAAQPLAALLPYGCGVPLAGSDRLWQLQIWRYFRQMCKAPKLVIARRPKADVAISGRQLRFRRGLPVIRPGTARLPRPLRGLAMTNSEVSCQ